MAQVGQLTPSGGREWALHPGLSGCRGVTVPVNCTLNFIGAWLREQNAANANNVVAGIYTTAGALLFQSSVLTAGISSTSTFALKQMAFSGQSLSAGNYILLVTASGTNGSVVLQGQNDSAGLPTYAAFDPEITFPTLPSDISAMLDATATRQWDILLDYTEVSSGPTGTLAATESGADQFDAVGGVGNNGIRLTLRDTDTGALAANLTGLIVSVRTGSNTGSTLYSSTSGTTNGSGVYQLASSAVGNIGDYVYVTVEKSDHTVVAAYRVQVIDLNA